MTQLWVPKPRKFVRIAAPKTASDIKKLCGVDLKSIEPYWDSVEASENHRTFAIIGVSQDRQDTVRGWEIYREITGFDPECTPQPTGNCVAGASEEIVQLTQCVDIKAGDRETYKDIFNPFHYATGRVLVAKNRLKGRPGSFGGAQATAHTKYGVIEHTFDMPKYNKRNVDRWGDGNKAEGTDFRDYMELASDRLIGSTARTDTMDQLLDAISNYHFATIASNRGYTRKPKGGARGFHIPSGNWSHQMQIWGYSISGNWIAIKNQWGPTIHGKLIDLETGEPWPPGFLRVRLDDFERKHFRGSETIAYSRFDGFPEQRFDYSTIA